MSAVSIAYVATLLAFVAIDFVWLSTAGQGLYRPILGEILIDGFRPAPAILFYLVYVAGLVYFAVKPQAGVQPWVAAAIDGAAFGFAAYATYDLTNQATLRHWSSAITIVDLAWGTILSAAAAAIGAAVTTWIRSRI